MNKHNWRMLLFYLSTLTIGSGAWYGLSFEGYTLGAIAMALGLVGWGFVAYSTDEKEQE